MMMTGADFGLANVYSFDSEVSALTWLVEIGIKYVCDSPVGTSLAKIFQPAAEDSTTSATNDITPTLRTKLERQRPLALHVHGRSEASQSFKTTL